MCALDVAITLEKMKAIDPAVFFPLKSERAARSTPLKHFTNCVCTGINKQTSVEC